MSSSANPPLRRYEESTSDDSESDSDSSSAIAIEEEPTSPTAPTATENEPTSPVEDTGVSSALPSSVNMEITEIAAVVAIAPAVNVKKTLPRDKASKLQRKCMREQATKIKKEVKDKKVHDRTQKRLDKKNIKNAILRGKAAEKRRIVAAAAAVTNSTNSTSTSMFETSGNEDMEIDPNVPVVETSAQITGNVFATNFEVENIALELEVKNLKEVVRGLKVRVGTLAQKLVDDEEMVTNSQLMMKQLADGVKEKDELRDAITRLVYSSHTHQTYLLGQPTCPVSLDTLFPNDQVCDFIGCKCNCMVKTEWSEQLMEKFKQNKKIKCVVCQEMIFDLKYKSVAQAVNDFEWAAIRRLSGCETVEEVLKRYELRVMDEKKDNRAQIVETERAKFDLKLTAAAEADKLKYDTLRTNFIGEFLEKPIIIPE